MEQPGEGFLGYETILERERSLAFQNRKI